MSLSFTRKKFLRDFKANYLLRVAPFILCTTENHQIPNFNKTLQVEKEVFEKKLF